MAVKEFEKVRLEIDGAVATLVLNDPTVMNAIGYPMLSGMKAALDLIEDPDEGVRCVILTGEGRGFSAGANLSDGGLKGENDDPKYYDAGASLDAHHPVLRRFRNLKMPLITAVNGAAAGIGMSYALIGDMILAARSAYFLQAFRRIGLVPDGGSTWLLPRMIGWPRAKELSLLGDKLPAEKALEWGLVNRVYADADLMAEARTLAQDLAKGPTVSLGLIRRAYWESLDNTYEQQINLERQSQLAAGRTEDAAEGIAAFLQKRPAEFKGR